MLNRATILSAAILAAVIGCGGDTAPNTTSPTSASTTTASTDDRASVARLAEVELDDGRRIVLRAHSAAGSTTGPCLTILGVDDRKRGCGRAPSERDPSLASQPIIAEAVAQTKSSAPVEVYGATTPQARTVVVRYGTKGVERAARAILLEADDHGALIAAKIGQPFDYFFAELPPDADARAITATVLDGTRTELGSVSYARFRDAFPTGFIVER